jgi:hypothetical protein
MRCPPLPSKDFGANVITNTSACERSEVQSRRPMWRRCPSFFDAVAKDCSTAPTANAFYAILARPE